MCALCLAAFGAIVAALAPGTAGTFQLQKINQFQALIEANLPPDARGQSVRDRMAERMIRLASRPGIKELSTWRSCLPLFRPNEARLKERAERAARDTFVNVRDAILEPEREVRNRAAARTVEAMAEFYTDLAHYDGDKANRIMRRAFTLLGPTVVPLIMLGTGGWLAMSPEICGAIPGPLGNHAHHVFLGVGVAGVLGFMGLAATSRGQDWYLENGTPAQDRNLGAHRAESAFWQTLAEEWSRDSRLTSLVGQDALAKANAVLRRLDWSGEGVLGACEDYLREAPTCSDCTTEPAKAG